MDIRGPNFGNYDARHLSHVQGEIARTVKPNVLRQLEQQDLDEETFQRLLTEDLVDLSPDAKQLLLRMRKERRRKGRRSLLDLGKHDFAQLLEGLDELRRQVEEDSLREAGLLSGQEAKPFLPPQIPLSNHNPDIPRARPTRAASGDSAAPGLNRAGDLARKMVVYSPSPDLGRQLALEVQVMGAEVVAQVKQFGVRTVILERHRALTELRIHGMYVVAPSEKTFDGRPWSRVRGLYDTSRRILVVGEELLGLPNRSTTRHEFAHAYDHAFSEKNHRRLPLSVQLWNSFQAARKGMVSDYAQTNPAEYFAESVEAFFQDGARDYLRQRDPLMFDYLARLFVP